MGTSSGWSIATRRESSPNSEFRSRPSAARRSRVVTVTTSVVVAVCITFLSVYTHVVTAFKASDFKTCATSSFCARHRDVRSHDPARAHKVEGPFSVDADGTSATASVVRVAGHDRPLTLTVTSYGHEGVVRVRFDDPQFPRYQVKDVLVDALDGTRTKFQSTTRDEKNGETTMFVLATPHNVDPDSQPITVRITHDPLRIALSIGGKETAVFNNHGKFDFERFAENGPEDEKEKVGDDDDETASEKPEKQSGWSETFNGHVDKRPFGPMAIALDISFPGDAVDVYGIPERATSLSLKDTKAAGGGGVESGDTAEDGEKDASADEEEETSKDDSQPYSEPYRLYNLDVFEYDHDSPFGLYGSIPVMHARSVRGDTTKGGMHGGMSKQTQESRVTYSAVYVHNPTETYVDVMRSGNSSEGAETLWISESGAADFFIMPGPTPGATQRQYSQITGTTAMPPAFALGYHQCRWNYVDETDVAAVDAGFDQRDIPYDVLWLDIEHTDGKRYMTWDKTHFPSPKRMIDDVASRGRKMVTIVDPHVKKDDNYGTHVEATQKRLYVRQPNAGGTDFDGWCWPGSSAYLDVVSKKVREWWSGKFSLQNYVGSTNDLHVWNDMNEPSVFNGPEITMRKDLLHEEGATEHREVHNVFGMFYHAATADGLRLRNNERPLVLSRAFFAGTQRIGPVWTGDNAADWHHLRKSIPMTLALGISGLTWSGADVGGFFGDPDAELMTRWYQLGAFYPFFRGHAHLDTKRREPWMFGEPYTRTIRTAIRTRYQLMPYLYTLFEAAHREGTPVLRPLWFEFPDDDSVAKNDISAMVGPALLLAPVLEKSVESIVVYLPKGVWYDYDTHERHVGPKTVTKAVTLATTPLFIRGGFIIPRKDRARRSVKAMGGDPLTLLVAPDENGDAVGETYVDDGVGYAYVGSDAFIRRGFVFKKGALTCGSPSKETAKGSGVESGNAFAAREATKPGVGGDFPDANVKVERVLVLDSQKTIRQPNVRLGEDWQLTV